MTSNYSLALIAALSFSAAAASFAQSAGMGDMPMKNDGMPACKDMQGMDMKDMDRQKCMDMMKGMNMKAASQPGMAGKMRSHQADGVVKEVDVANGKVTLAHEAVKSLDWPAMSMAFAVKDKALFDKLAVGRKVHVEFRKEGNDYVVTAVK